MFDIQGLTSITVPHEEGELTFKAVPFGPNNFKELRDSIEEEGFRMPTLTESVSIIHAALHYPEVHQNSSIQTYRELITNKLYEGRWIAGNTGILYIPGEGLYVKDDPRVEITTDCLRAIEILMKKEDLEARLKEGDRRVRFVPDGYEVENLKEGVRTNPAIVGLVGQEGAKKLAEIKKVVDAKYGTHLYHLLNAEHSRKRFGSASIMRLYGSLNGASSHKSSNQNHQD